ncbi:hypothetical protein HG530_008149 [Fusarium avenaceum]|nr:hypothetical protein HG530_008149 [Fusarium avenaceum]
MPQIQESIIIAASPAKIWGVLMDLKSWPEWNTFVTSIQVQPPHTELSVGSKQIITINKSQSYTNTVSILQPEKELRWNGSIITAAFFDTEHWCTLEEVVGDEVSTRFTQGERFSGILAPVLGAIGKLEELREGYVRMNQDLKQVVEGTVIRKVKFILAIVMIILTTRDARLDQMKIGQVQTTSLVDDVCELWNGILHSHALECAPWTKTKSDTIGSDSFGDFLHDFVDNARPVFDTTAKLIITLVADVLEKLIQKISVCAMNLNTIKPSTYRILCGCDKRLDHFMDFIFGHSPWLSRTTLKWDGARCDDINPLLFSDFNSCSAAHGKQLHKDETTLAVDFVGDCLPGSDLVLIPDTRCSGKASTGRR